MSLASSLLEAPTFPDCFEPGSAEERAYMTALVSALKDQVAAYKETCASIAAGGVNQLLVSSVLESGRGHERCRVAELSGLIDTGTVNNADLMEKLTVRHLLDPGLTMDSYGPLTQEALRRNIREHHLRLREMLMVGDLSGGPALTTKTVVRTVTTTTTVSRMTGSAEPTEGKMKVEYVREREVRYVKE